MLSDSSVPDVTKDNIIAGLRELGISSGAGVMVHSSLSSFGHVEGGAQTVIEAFMEVLTPEGTLMMPSFNHGGAFAEGAPGYYDPLETPTTNGTIPDLFWRLPGVYRSLQPTHAFAAWGHDAERYTKYHHRTITMGPESPLGLLQADGGFGVFVGVDYASNSFHHVVEMTLEVPCLGQRTEACPIRLPDGRLVEGRTWGWRERGCPFTDGGRYVDEMQSRGLHRQVTVGNSQLMAYRLQDCFEVIANILTHGKAGFPPCSRCPIRPRQVAETVPSDWDRENKTLLPDSPAWDY